MLGWCQNCNDAPGVMGPCRGFFREWTFSGGSCVQFIYGGCRGSGNRFKTQAQCQSTCG